MKRNFMLAVLSLLPLLGCAPKSGPSISIVNVRLTDVTAFETTAVFTLRFGNDTPAPMQLNGGSHKIYINGLYVGEGLTSQQLEVPRLGTATQEVTVHMNNIALATRIKPIIESQSFDYRIRSVLFGKVPAGRLRSESTGRLELKDFTPSEEGTNQTNQFSGASNAPSALR